MKKTIVLAVAAIIFSCNAFSQDRKCSFFGETYNYAYTQHKYVGNAFPELGDYAMLHGFNVGPILQQQLYKGLVLVTGLQYQFTMYQNGKTSIVGNATEYLMSHNLKVPVKVGYSFLHSDKWTFTFFAGPSLDFNVALVDKTKFEGGNYEQYDLINGKYKYKMGDLKGDFKSNDYKMLSCFDIPLGIGAIIKYDSYGFKFEYEWGLVNRLKNSESKNDQFRADQFVIGFFFAI